MPENTDITNITDEDQLTIEDFLEQTAEAKYHTALEIWQEVLKSARLERPKKITPQWANRICTTYHQMTFADMPEFKERYFDKLEELLTVLTIELATDEEALNLTTPEEDAELNAFHYINVLIDWQKVFLQWELDWDPAMLSAPIELAAISEVHRMFFDKTGITSLLDNIPFEFTDEHRELLATTLQQMKQEQEGQ